MDFNAAILAHVDWKKKFQAHLAGATRLDPKVVAADDVCELGKWIHGSREHQAMPEFQALRRAHAEFHRQAAQVVISSGYCAGPGEALKMLELATPFGKASGRCVKAITDLRDKLTALEKK